MARHLIDADRQGIIDDAVAAAGGGGGGGTSVHNQLTGRDAEDAHPIGAVTGLQEALDALATEAWVAGGYVAVGGNADLQDVSLTGTLEVEGATTLGTTSVPAPTADGHAANKGYVDDRVAQVAATAVLVLEDGELVPDGTAPGTLIVYIEPAG